MIKLQLLSVVTNSIQIAINRTHVALSFRQVSSTRSELHSLKIMSSARKSRPNPGSCFFH